MIQKYCQSTPSRCIFAIFSDLKKWYIIISCWEYYFCSLVISPS